MAYLSNFNFTITGPENAPKLVFLHGVMGFSANWRRIVKAFESEYQVLVYDQRGHGRSFQPASGYGPEDYADDLLKIIDELQWREITLVGHSMGGRAALNFAHRFPERVKKLVIEDIGPGIRETAASYIVRLIDSVPVPFVSKREAKAWFDTQFLEIFAENPKKEELAAYLYANLIENEKKEAVWRFYAQGVKDSITQARAADRWHEVRGLKVPTLVVRGEQSSDLTHETYSQMLRENSVIQGTEIPNSGHWVHSDQPDLFIDALKRFFQEA